LRVKQNYKIKKVQLSKQKSDIEKQLQSFTKNVRNEAKRERDELLGINKPVHSKSSSISSDDEIEKAIQMSLLDELKRKKEDVTMPDIKNNTEPTQVRSQAAIDEEEELRRAIEISQQINIPNNNNTIPPIHQSLDSFLNQMLNLSQGQLLEKRRREAEEQEKLEMNRVEKISQDQEYEESLAKDREKDLEEKKGN